MSWAPGARLVKDEEETQAQNKFFADDSPHVMWAFLGAILSAWLMTITMTQHVQARVIHKLETGHADKGVRTSAHLARVYESVEIITGTPDDITGTREHRLHSLDGVVHVVAFGQGIEIRWAAQNNDGNLSSAEDSDKDTTSLRL
ncbi:hypothetical protein BJV77DRAFT_962233 [Russula vinacea]|nr:hypothetical protein BJV77DRAFT_962233 [Russula vinacea]